MLGDLADETERRWFERGIVDLIKQSALLRADFLVLEAIQHFGSADLKRAAESCPQIGKINGWDVVCADLLETDIHLRNMKGQGIEIVELSLVNRWQSGRYIDDLLLERQFYLDTALNKYSAPAGFGYGPTGQTKRPVTVTGFAEVMAIQRRQNHNASHPQWHIDRLLSGLLLVVRYQRTIDLYLREQGLPLPVAMYVEMDHASRPMESNIEDLGPQARRFIDHCAHAPKPLLAGDQILAERRQEREDDFQQSMATTFAKNREIHRIIRFYPFYRFAARNKVADIWEAHMNTTLDLCEIPRPRAFSWRISRAKLTELLTQIAVNRSVPDVEAALDPAHTDILHAQWLAKAKDPNYKLGSAMCLHEKMLAHALAFGGPFVEDRWERAKPYAD